MPQLNKLLILVLLVPFFMGIPASAQEVDKPITMFEGNPVMVQTYGDEIAYVLNRDQQQYRIDVINLSTDQVEEVIEINHDFEVPLMGLKMTPVAHVWDTENVYTIIDGEVTQYDILALSAIGYHIMNGGGFTIDAECEDELPPVVIPESETSMIGGFQEDLCGSSPNFFDSRISDYSTMYSYFSEESFAYSIVSDEVTEIEFDPEEYRNTFFAGETITSGWECSNQVQMESYMKYLGEEFVPGLHLSCDDMTWFNSVVHIDLWIDEYEFTITHSWSVDWLWAQDEYQLFSGSAQNDISPDLPILRPIDTVNRVPVQAFYSNNVEFLVLVQASAERNELWEYIDGEWTDIGYVNDSCETILSTIVHAGYAGGFITCSDSRRESYWFVEYDPFANG